MLNFLRKLGSSPKEHKACFIKGAKVVLQPSLRAQTLLGEVMTHCFQQDVKLHTAKI